MKSAANVIRRTRCDAGGHHCQFQSRGQRILERDSGFWGPDLTLVRNNTVALVFNSAAFKVASWRRHRCRCTAPDVMDDFSSRVTVSATLCWVKHWEYMLSKATCWGMIKFALLMASYDNLAMLTALRIVNIFSLFHRRIITLDRRIVPIVPLGAHELLQWKLIYCRSCRRHPWGEGSASRNHLHVLN
jgi:hypothetical protein